MAARPLALRAGIRARRERSGNRWAYLAVPGVAFLAVLFGWPLVDLALKSFNEPSFSENYSVFTDTAIYRRSLLTTFQIAGVTTLVCLLVGYPYAYLMHSASRRGAIALGFLVLMPFWTSVLVRNFAWTEWLQDTGIINTWLGHLGIGPLQLMRNATGTTIGMTHVMLPYMVLSLFASMRRIDPDLLPAAESLGASPARAFRRVFIPLTKPGIYAGCLIVFVISLGFYITPALLGDPTHSMVSELIVDQVNHQLNFGVGAALGLVLLLATLIVVALGTRVVRLGEVVGYEEES